MVHTNSAHWADPAPPPGPRNRSDLVIDIALAAALVVIAVVGTGPAAAEQNLDAASPIAYVLAVAAAVAVVGWRITPRLSFAVVGVLTMVYLAAGFAFGPILISLLVATYGLGTRVPLREIARWAGVVTVAVVVVTVLRTQVAGVGDWADCLRAIGWLIVPLAVGIAVQIRRRASVEVRDAHLAQAASEERVRMAQDLHDVVGHGLAVIAMQAGVALHVLDRDPAKARESLEAIRATSREALDGLRGQLAAFTANGSAAVPGAATTPGSSGDTDDPGTATSPSGEDRADRVPLRPAPSLSGLDVLLDRIRTGGMRVDARVDVPAPLPPDVDGAAFRIVQESLTNVLRHARAGIVQVTVVAAGDSLTVDVVDDGSGRDSSPGSSGPAGSGIDGMRRRAVAVGGTLRAAPNPGGGFAVRAVLPLHAGPAASAVGSGAGAGTVHRDHAEGDPA